MPKLILDYFKGDNLYSDGDIEDEILKIVNSNSSINEILTHDDRWPILYHLTSMRRNLLEWYSFAPDSYLLEIGGGCGALTGLFSEKCKTVTSIELSKRRAEIIFQRHHKHDHLDIVVGNFNEIPFSEKFDYITLIGVLEYAGSFSEGPTPYLSFLEKVRKHLKPKGHLLIAIENKFGLKYFSGANEDHTGKTFDGLEGYPETSSVCTFGKFELEELLKKSGYGPVEFYYPFPDYKIPHLIFSDQRLPEKDELWVDTPNYDNDRMILFNEAKAYREIIKNKQFPFFSNSFLLDVENE